MVRHQTVPSDTAPQQLHQRIRQLHNHDVTPSNTQLLSTCRPADLPTTSQHIPQIYSCHINVVEVLAAKHGFFAST